MENLTEAIPLLHRSPLFIGVSEDEIALILKCLDARMGSFEKDEAVTRRGDHVEALGVVISGSVLIITEDYWGNRNIISTAGPGRIFGESFACAADNSSHVDVVADGRSRVMFLNVRHIMTTCSNACVFHEKLISNLLGVLAGKNVALTDKVEHITKRTTRDKVLSYLSAESLATGSPIVEIPFNRQQLADYLSVERSALSTTLGKLQDEGLIRFEKNRFELL